MAILTKNGIMSAMLCDNIKIKNFDYSNLQPNSYDIHISTNFGIYPMNDGFLDVRSDNEIKYVTIPEDGYILQPGELYLFESNEHFESNKYVMEVSGSSSLARLGITIHQTASYSNLGHSFNWVLEVSVVKPVKIYKFMKIGQVYFHTISGSISDEYTGKYMNEQMGGHICPSKSFLEK